MHDGNFYQLFEGRLQQDPSAVALELDNGETLTREWLDTMSGRYANALGQLGCVRGDRIAVQLDKSHHALALYLACMRAGLCYLPVNTAYRAGELKYLLEDAGPAILFRASTAEPLPEADISPGIKLVSFGPNGEGAFAELGESAGTSFQTVDLSSEEPAALLYTSGTTGRPKGAIISHRSVSFSAERLSAFWGFSDTDIVLHSLPIFHSHGLFISFNLALITGARLLLQKKFDADDILAALPRSSVFMGVPTYYHRLLASPLLTRDLCRNMRLFVSGSAPLSAEVHREFESRTGHRILERYGSTETMILCSNPLDGQRRAGSVGPPIPGVELRIADDADDPLPKGSIGMVEARGPGLFSGYLNKPEQTQQEFSSDGFFRTGDLGRIDEDGYVYITGRAKDLIISGGYNVYPAEVEAVIEELPAVKESAVVGAPHSDFGECVVAFIIPTDENNPPDPDVVVRHVKSRLANYKVPKQIVVVIDLPRNILGKILKNELRASLVGESQNFN